MGSRNNNTCAAADGGVAETQITQSGTTISSSATIQTPGGNNNNNNGVLTTSQSSAYTSVPPRSSTILSDPSPSTSQPRSSSTSDPSILGGRCANGWGSDCICLDESTCRNKWKGTPYTGYSPNWPCPNEPDNVMACVVKPCLGQVAPAQCLWKEACSTTDAKLICPGGSDFICCGHSW
ncbi:hypothetical protein B0H63DRAFT_392855 [Podospora didyma]|uniref:Uncharacterized protein n=1 Tax=Podospora didyma TaxID=330526 RepID=A0AAE0U1G6_9PEZI|nr:hypothetical protein B0H63DRAFT_392855 [Podospora didyma]